MPIITVQFIKDVVATPEQKRELVIRLTDTFVDVLGDVVRPFVYCLIKETPVGEWAIAGVPMPDLAYLTGDKHAKVIERSNDLMRAAIAQMAQSQPPAASNGNGNGSSANGYHRRDEQADKVWRHEDAVAASNGVASGNGQMSAAERADKVWRGEIAPAPARQLTLAERNAAADALWRGDGPDLATAAHAAEHRRLFERWFEELWNKKNYDLPHELVDPEFIAHGAGGQDIKQGPAGVAEMVKAWHTAMPDGRMTIDDLITEGDLSTIRMTWRATHTGPFGNIPPSGNKIEVTSIGIDRVINGKITEGWGEVNLLAMLQQMGAIPTPEAAPAAPAQSAPPATPPPSSDVHERARVERNKRVIERFYDAVNNKRMDVFREIVHPDFVNHGGASGDLVGPDALVASLQTFYEAMPDWHVSEDYVVAQRDRVASRGTISGTHRGPFMGSPATGKPVSWTGIIIYRLDEEGRIIERWQDFDALSMGQQLGVIPRMGSVPQPN